MHTGYYIGFVIAAAANYFIGSQYGWRYMFIIGGAPAILVAFFFNRLHEPACDDLWKSPNRVICALRRMGTKSNTPPSVTMTWCA